MLIVAYTILDFHYHIELFEKVCSPSADVFAYLREQQPCGKELKRGFLL